MKTIVILYSVGTFIYSVLKKYSEKKKERREREEEDE